MYLFFIYEKISDFSFIPNLVYFSFIPQGATMTFYGIVGLFISFYFGSIIFWNIGGGFDRRRKICVFILFTWLIFTVLFTLLFILGILQRYCACKNTIHITMRVRNPADSLFMSLCVSKHMHYPCQCSCTIHVTMRVKTLFTLPYINF